MFQSVSPVANQLAKASLFCKCLYGVLIVGYLLSFNQDLYDGLAIVPRYLIPPYFWLWTLLTYFIIERNIIVLIADMLCVHLCGSVLEPLWKPNDLLIYLVIVNASVGLLTAITLLGLYMVHAVTVGVLFDTTIHGMPGFIGALLVAVKQIVPDSTLVQTPVGRLKNTHLPALVLTVMGILAIVRIMKPIVILMYLIGSYSGWIYLRYYQKHESSGTKGDMSEHFAFPSFFPSILQPPMETLSNAVYKVLVRIRICKPAIRHIDMNSLTSVTVSLPDMDPNDAERRRQKALRELNERLNKAKEQSLSDWPTMEAGKEPPATHHSPNQSSSLPPQQPPPSSSPELLAGSEGFSPIGRENELQTPVMEGSASPIPSEPKLVLHTSGSEAEQ